MEDSKRKEIGQRINAALAAAGMKQKELASIIGVHDNAISYFTSGARTPNLTQVIGISHALHVSTDYLLGLTDIMTPETTVQAIADYTGLEENAISALHSFYFNTKRLQYIPHVQDSFIEQFLFLNGIIDSVFSDSFQGIKESIYFLRKHAFNAEKIYKYIVTENDPFSPLSADAEKEKTLAKGYKAEILEWFVSFLDEYFSSDFSGLDNAAEEFKKKLIKAIDEKIEQKQKYTDVV
ncbi:MAG: helix-turn-helix transcriptional regulator [Clostridia bacterium]|nr:helix-turn-helix transcriptional regulator [Clostridia bacterium]